MQQEFDAYGNAETPSYILTNPDKEQLYSLSNILDRKYSPRYNALGEISFIAPYQVNDNVSPYWDLLTYRRLAFLPDVGYFMITDVSEKGDGIKRYKDITAQSLEVELALKRITLFKGTYKFYDILDTNGTLLQTILAYLPGWSVGTVDTELLSLYRYFNVNDTTIYDFLMNDVEEAYQCIFTFDSFAKTISAVSIPNATSTTDVYLSYDNLIKSIEIKEVTDELVTALTVCGGGGLSINQVNPLGTDTIYNFDYYKTTDWMSQGLIDALDAWEQLIDDNQANYADLLTSLIEDNNTLIGYTGELADLQGEYDALEGVQSVRIQQGLSLTEVNAQLAAKQTEIDSKNTQIDSIQTSIDDIQSQLEVINTALSFETNFTEAQLLELSAYIVGSTYQNDNFIQTDAMTQAEIQAMAQELYDQGVTVLAKVSQPRYEFSIDAVNFISLEEFSIFTEQLELGSVITLELEEGVFIYPALLGIDMNYDNPSDFKLIFGNRLRLDDSSFIFSDLFNQAVKGGISTKFNSERWSNWSEGYKSEVTGFINSSLNASLNNVISGSGQDVLINQNGIRLRQSLEGGGYSDEQVWMNNGTIAFTRDNWDTAALALGKVSTASGSAFGLVASVVVGRLLAGNELVIENEGGTFSVDGAGATLTDANFTLNTTNGKTRIFLDPDNGIKIQGNAGGTWVDKMYADSSGNLNITGNLELGGGNYIRTNGYAKLGALTITPTTASFTGTVSASKLDGIVDWSQISNIPASRVSSGNLSGMSMSGTSSIGFPGGIITGSIATDMTISAYGNLNLKTQTTNGTITIGGHPLYTAQVNGYFNAARLYSGDRAVATEDYVTSRGYITGTSGRDGTFSIYSSSGGVSSWKNYWFEDGLLKAVY